MKVQENVLTVNVIDVRKWPPQHSSSRRVERIRAKMSLALGYSCVGANQSAHTNSKQSKEYRTMSDTLNQNPSEIQQKHKAKDAIKHSKINVLTRLGLLAALTVACALSGSSYLFAAPKASPSCEKCDFNYHTCLNICLRHDPRNQTDCDVNCSLAYDACTKACQ